MSTTIFLIIAGSLITNLFISCVFSIDENGGWFTDESSTIAKPGPCNIDIRDSSMSENEFLQKYAYNQPVIVKDGSNNKKFKELTSKENLLTHHGDKLIRLSSANTHSYDKVDVTLTHYVDHVMRPQTLDRYGNETFYWFGDNNYTEWADVFAVYNPPPFTLPGLTAVYSFGLAGAGTGVPFHFHGPGFAEVIFGRKRWFLYPPHQQPKFNPDRSTLHWLVEDYPHLHGPDMPYECTLHPGEAMYFPDHWWHGTLNLDTSVFISTFLG